MYMLVTHLFLANTIL